MATPQPKSLITILGALAVAAVGTYLGLDGIGGGSTTAPGTPAVKAKASTVISTTSSATPDRADTCPVRELPVEVEDTIADISDGAPYAHGEFDNRHFGNYERVLPKEKSSYYREFTVDTPGVNHRGERRIVVGGGTATDPEVWYYTDDHYESFCFIPDAEEY